MSQAASPSPTPPTGGGTPQTLVGVDWVGRAVAVIAVLLIAASLGQKAYRLTLPTDGWAFTSGDIGGPDEDRPIYTANLLGGASPLQPGDKLLAVEDQSFEDILDRAKGFGVRAPHTWQSGATVRYTVERDGRPVVLDVPLYTWSAGSILRGFVDPGFVALLDLAGSLLLAAVGWFVFLRRPREPAARPLLLFSVSLLVTSISNAVVSGGLPEMLAPGVAPVASFFSGWIWGAVMFPSLLLLTFIFPRPKHFVRRFPGPVVAVLYGITPALIALLGPIAAIGWLVVLAMALLSLAALAHSVFTVRDRLGRAQVRWVVSGLAVMVVGFIPMNLGGFGLFPPPPPWVEAIWFPALLLAVALGFAVAILRYRLFDIDLIINRVLVYGGLSGCVVAVYVLIVGLLGSLLEIQSSLVLSLVVTGIVAVLFQPLRDRLQRAANRLLYGQRDEPYRVLARLGHRLEGALEPAAILPTLVQAIAESLKLPYVAIELGRSGPDEGAVATGAPTTEVRRFPLTHQGEIVGQLVVSPRRGEATLSEGDRRLLDDLARQAGVAVHGVRLTDDLRRSNADLRAARERLVSAREEERRRLRRDLHDGLGPTLGGLTLKLDVAADLVEEDPARTRTLLRDLKTQAQTAIGDIRRLVYALRPPALDDLGLVGALRADAAQHELGGLQVAVEAPEPLPPLPAAVEVAAYRIAQEALTNVARHAGARRCAIHLAVGVGALELEVADDGRGLPTDRGRGVGMTSMRERAEELGGTCLVEAPPAGGTRVRATLPLAGAVAPEGPDTAPPALVQEPAAR